MTVRRNLFCIALLSGGLTTSLSLWPETFSFLGDNAIQITHGSTILTVILILMWLTSLVAPSSRPARTPTVPEPSPKAPTLDHLTIFISPSSQDDTSVLRLRRALQNHGHTVYDDSQELDQNGELASQIKNLIDRSNRVLVLVSPSAAESGWVARELDYAARQEQIRPNLDIIPLLLP
ncbi:MAG: toll/interleukin-1 receptor domain-containing protein, partial [Verrucomicrobiota bacterium]